MVAGFFGGEISGSLWVSDVQEGPDPIATRINTSATFYCSAPYDSLITSRKNANNNFDCYGDFHNAGLDYVNNKICSLKTLNQEVTRIQVYNYIKEYLSTTPSLCPSGVIDTSKFKIAIYDTLLNSEDMVRFADTTIAYDSAKLVRCFSESSKLLEYDKQIYVPYLRYLMQMTDFAGIMTYTKGYENTIINSKVDNVTKDRLKKAFAIQRASLCYWDNALEE